MPRLKSLEDLKKLRDEAQRDIRVRMDTGTKITVGMGTCGIAAGARDTMKAVLETIETGGLQGIVVTQTGCIGLCEWEPIVQVTIGVQPKVTYGKVTPERAQQILKEHVVGGQVVKSFVVPA